MYIYIVRGHYIKLYCAFTLVGRKWDFMKYTAMDIANWFIWRDNIENYDNEGDRISLLKLLKLLYYAEGCSLALGRGDLFSDKIVAWEHGPVVEEVYRAFDNPYKLDCDDTNIIEKINNDKNTKELLEQVYQVFGAYTAWALRNKTHAETPWLNATGNGKYLNHEISRADMKSYFKENYIGE